MRKRRPKMPSLKDRIAVARLCLRRIWRIYDHGGQSMGRSYESQMLETAMALLDPNFHDGFDDLGEEEFQRLAADMRHDVLYYEVEKRAKEQGLQSAFDR